MLFRLLLKVSQLWIFAIGAAPMFLRKTYPFIFQSMSFLSAASRSSDSSCLPRPWSQLLVQGALAPEPGEWYLACKSQIWGWWSSQESLSLASLHHAELENKYVSTSPPTCTHIWIIIPVSILILIQYHRPTPDFSSWLLEYSSVALRNLALTSDSLS